MSRRIEVSDVDRNFPAEMAAIWETNHMKLEPFRSKAAQKAVARSVRRSEIEEGRIKVNHEIPRIICETAEQRAIWERIDQLIEAALQDGIGAEGIYSEHVHSTQRAYIDGLRAGRLAAINALKSGNAA